MQWKKKSTGYAGRAGWIRPKAKLPRPFFTAVSFADSENANSTKWQSHFVDTLSYPMKVAAGKKRCDCQRLQSASSACRYLALIGSNQATGYAGGFDFPVYGRQGKR